MNAISLIENIFSGPCGACGTPKQNAQTKDLKSGGMAKASQCAQCPSQTRISPRDAQASLLKRFELASLEPEKFSFAPANDNYELKPEGEIVKPFGDGKFSISLPNIFRAGKAARYDLPKYKVALRPVLIGENDKGEVTSMTALNENDSPSLFRMVSKLFDPENLLVGLKQVIATMQEKSDEDILIHHFDKMLTAVDEYIKAGLVTIEIEDANKVKFKPTTSKTGRELDPAAILNLNKLFTKNLVVKSDSFRPKLSTVINGVEIDRTVSDNLPNLANKLDIALAHRRLNKLDANQGGYS